MLQNRYLSIVGGFMIHLVIGSSFIWGNIGIYVTSYLKKNQSDLSLNDTFILLPIMILISGPFNFLGANVAMKLGTRLQIIISTVTIGLSVAILGIFLSSFVTNFSLFFLTYGIMFGMGVGFAVTLNQYVSPLMTGWSNFPNNKGRVTGIIMAGFGLSATIFNQIYTAGINPNNIPPDYKETNGKVTHYYYTNEIADDAPVMIRWLALCYTILAILGILFMGEIQDNQSEQENFEVGLKKSLKSWRYWQLVIAAIMSSAYGLYIPAAFKNFGITRIQNDQFLAFVGSVGAFINGGCRVVWAQLVDWIGFKTTYYIILGIQIVISSTIYTFAQDEATLLIFISFSFLCEGGHFSIFPAICAKKFGKRTGGKLYGLLFCGFGLSAITGFILQYFIIEYVGYQIIFYILCLMTVTSGFIILTFKETNVNNSVLSSSLLKN